MAKERHITLPAGFTAAGVRCGIKASGREDLTILAAGRLVAAAVLTTRNQVTGAPVQWCRRVLPRGYGRMRAIVVNSGNSNVCTGPAGLRDAEEMAARTAALLGTRAANVLVASTGVIGHRLPMEKVRAGIDAAFAALGTGNDDLAVRGMMTTDTVPKSAVATGRIGGTSFTVAGIAKGVGMIAPSMATMISLITTDLAIAPAALHRVLRAAAERTFHAVTVDSDTSTSDTLAAFASGACGNAPLTSGSEGLKRFAAAAESVCGSLARQLAADGEGATKLIEVTVSGARNVADARAAAMAIANSPLFKCAVNGGDPNWGRIAAAAGKSAAMVLQDRLTVKIGGVTLMSRGLPRKFDLGRVTAHLAGKEIMVVCDLGIGKGRYTALTCDLSREYVTINADYHT
jgi:glutamate N-acetyltransferase/amino-acid N-acetyltransferase